jgi:hypothetical protein
MTTISLKLPEPLLREVEEAAADRGVPKSAIIRESVEAAMRKRRKPKKQPSCLDLIRDLVGTFDGPPDLSANKKKYLAETLMADYERQQRMGRR